MWRTNQDKIANWMVKHLGLLQAPFGEDQAAFAHELRREFLDRAFELHERFLSTVEDYYLDTHYLGDEGKNFSGTLQDFDNVTCFNILNRDDQRVVAHSSNPSVDQLHSELYLVCSLRPMLIHVGVTAGNDSRNETCHLAEMVAVAWRPGRNPQRELKHLKRNNGPGESLLYGFFK